MVPHGKSVVPHFYHVVPHITTRLFLMASTALASTWRRFFAHQKHVVESGKSYSERSFTTVLMFFLTKMKKWKKQTKNHTIIGKSIQRVGFPDTTTTSCDCSKSCQNDAIAVEPIRKRRVLTCGTRLVPHGTSLVPVWYHTLKHVFV